MFEADESIHSIEETLDAVIDINQTPEFTTKHVFTHMTWNMNVYRAHTQKVNLITHINGLKRRKRPVIIFNIYE